MSKSRPKNDKEKDEKQVGANAATVATEDKDEGKMEAKCGSCLKSVADGDDGVECEICGLWFHCRCQGIPEQMYKAMKQFKDGLHWFCRGCQAGAEKLLGVMAKMLSKIERLEEELVKVKIDARTELTKAIKDLKTDMEQMNTRLIECEKGTA